MHFHVLVGLCGLYMPDSNDVYATRREAEQAARDLAKQYREDGERVSGSARERYYQVGANHCIEITECFEAECLTDLQGD